MVDRDIESKREDRERRGMSDLANLVDAAEMVRLEAAIGQFQSGEMDAERFTAVRLQHGIYGQRQDDVYMVRVKIPGGLLNRDRLVALADTIEKYSGIEFASITTRQDIQLHFVPINKVIPLVHRLAETGLTTREACGNTIRNVTGCALAGVCPREHTDIRPVVDATVMRFLRDPLTQHLPRKMKISVSGCEADCAQGMLHDIAAVAIEKEGKKGFKLMAGGGLGHKPRQAVTVAEFLDETELLAAMEAVVRLHHRYSDRTKRAKSRVKFLVDRFGHDGFIEKFREEFAVTRAAVDANPPAALEWRTPTDGPAPGPGAPRAVLAQRQLHRFLVPLSLPLGDVTPKELRAIADVMTEYGLDDVRTTQDQNLLLVDVPAQQLGDIRLALKSRGLVEPVRGDDVVACPGTWTCRLGITGSRDMARRLSGSDLDLKVRVSGCHNGCAQPYVGDIGLHGEGKRLHGKLIPHYRLHFGGNGMTGGRYAVVGPEVPVARVQAALVVVRKAFDTRAATGDTFATWAQRQGADYFKSLLEELCLVNEWDLAAVLRDCAEESDFRVLQLGGGECAGVAQESVAAAFAEAIYERRYRDTFFRQRMYIESAECAINALRKSAHGLALVFKPKTLDNWDAIFAVLADVAHGQTSLADALRRVMAALDVNTWPSDVTEFEKFCKSHDAWIAQAERVAASKGKLGQLDRTVQSDVIAAA